MRRATGNQGFAPDSFDFIITNPPFGSKVKLAEKSYLQNYDLGRKDIDWVDAKMNNVHGGDKPGQWSAGDLLSAAV